MNGLESKFRSTHLPEKWNLCPPGDFMGFAEDDSIFGQAA